MLSRCRRAHICTLILILLAGCKAAPRPSTPTPAPIASPALPTRTATRVPTSAPVPATPMATLPPSTPVPPTSVPEPTASTPPAGLATPTTAAVPNIELIVDNRDPAFSTTGTWFIGDGGQSYNGDCAWAPRGIQNIGYVRPQLPLAGAYEILAWWCGDPNHDQSQRARIEVYPTVGRVATYPVYVNLQENAGQWNGLGTYYLERNGFLGIDGGLDGNVVADAFRFVFRSPQHLVITPTPLPTQIPWTTHPPPPLEQLTSGDLSARLGLVQRFYPHTPLVSMEEVTFDDCQAFPRDGCSGTRSGWRVQVQYQDMLVTYRVSRDYRLVVLEPPDGLAGRQLLYLFGMQGSRFLRVDQYPDGTWHLSGSELDLTHASYVPLGTATVDKLHSLVQTYSSVRWGTADGVELRLYGLGEGAELSEEDQRELATLGAELAAAVW
jgi:hypothetical protein